MGATYTANAGKGLRLSEMCTANLNSSFRFNMDIQTFWRESFMVVQLYALAFIDVYINKNFLLYII